MNPTKHEDGPKIIPLEGAAAALADRHYSSTAGAVLELVENAVRADASRIEVFVASRNTREIVTQHAARAPSEVSQIAVLDNGAGMDPATMQLALQFGGTTDVAGGFSGLGLPSASMSESGRVDVWSWRDGFENTNHTYLEFDAVREGRLTDVPEPTAKAVPKRWRKAIGGAPVTDSGTLVVWSKLKGSRFETSEGLRHNLSDRIGQSFRRWLSAGSLGAYVTQFNKKYPATRVSTVVQPIDPLDLLPAPGIRQLRGPSQFVPFPNVGSREVSIPITVAGVEHAVSARFSMLSPESLDRWFSSARPSRALIGPEIRGLSVVRAGREIFVDDTFAVGASHEPQLWRAEISFEPELDEFFGLANNKQECRNLRAARRVGSSRLISKRAQISAEYRGELELQSDERTPWVKVLAALESHRSDMLMLINQAAEANRTVREQRQADEQQILLRQREAQRQFNRTSEAMAIVCGQQDPVERRGALVTERRGAAASHCSCCAGGRATGRRASDPTHASADDH